MITTPQRSIPLVWLWRLACSLRAFVLRFEREEEVAVALANDDGERIHLSLPISVQGLRKNALCGHTIEEVYGKDFQLSWENRRLCETCLQAYYRQKDVNGARPRAVR